MDILSLAGTLLLAAAQPQTPPATQAAPEAQEQAGHVKVFSGRDGALAITKLGAGKLEVTAGKVNEERPIDLSDAPPADPTAALLLPAVQKVREAAHRSH
jgi:hypothetical protein